MFPSLLPVITIETCLIQEASLPLSLKCGQGGRPKVTGIKLMVSTTDLNKHTLVLLGSYTTLQFYHIIICLLEKADYRFSSAPKDT